MISTKEIALPVAATFAGTRIFIYSRPASGPDPPTYIASPDFEAIGNSLAPEVEECGHREAGPGYNVAKDLSVLYAWGRLAPLIRVPRDPELRRAGF